MHKLSAISAFTFIHIKTRMITFLKVKLKNSDGQTNIDKYKVAAHKLLQNILSKQKFDLLRH